MEHSYMLKIIIKTHHFLIILLTPMIIYVSEIIMPVIFVWWEYSMMVHDYTSSLNSILLA